MSSVSIFSSSCWVVVRCGLVNHGGILGVGLSEGVIKVRLPTPVDSTSSGPFAQAFLRNVQSLPAILVLVVASKFS